MLRRDLLKTAGAAALGMTLSGALPATAQESVKVRFGYIPDDAVGSLVAIANANSLWAKYGLEAQLVSFTNGPSQVVAMEAGSLDAGFVGPGAMWLPPAGRAKVIGINILDFANVVLGQPGIGTDVSALKGKTVGVTEGTSGEMILLQALGKAGMTVDDIQKVNLDPATLVPAFITGQVDAAAIWYPPAATILQNQPEAVTLASDAAFYPELAPVSAFLASKEAVAANREGLVRLMAVLSEAMDIRYNDVPAAAKLTTAITGLDADTVFSTLGSDKVKLFKTAELVDATEKGLVYNWLNARNDLFLKLGKIETAIPAEEYYEAQIFLDGAALVK
ncbi:MAG: ABC transporter substrate-binding protein [Rhodobacteraceae bacterium]|nr:ABC transporter substrate-binding protein [Paracoccaceae bacterium]